MTKKLGIRGLRLALAGFALAFGALAFTGCPHQADFTESAEGASITANVQATSASTQASFLWTFGPGSIPGWTNQGAASSAGGSSPGNTGNAALANGMTLRGGNVNNGIGWGADAQQSGISPAVSRGRIQLGGNHVGGSDHFMEIANVPGSFTITLRYANTGNSNPGRRPVIFIGNNGFQGPEAGTTTQLRTFSRTVTATGTTNVRVGATGGALRFYEVELTPVGPPQTQTPFLWNFGAGSIPGWTNQGSASTANSSNPGNTSTATLANNMILRGGNVANGIGWGATARQSGISPTVSQGRIQLGGNHVNNAAYFMEIPNVPRPFTITLRYANTGNNNPDRRPVVFINNDRFEGPTAGSTTQLRTFSHSVTGAGAANVRVGVTGGALRFYEVEITSSGSTPAPPPPSAFNVDAGVWFETIFAYWTGVAGSVYNVYVAPAGTTNWRWVNNPSEAVVGQSTWRNNHSHLARNLGNNRWRVDVPGLAANSNQAYDLRIAEIRNGSPTGTAATVTGLRPRPFDRQGFAFSSTSPFGQTTGGHNQNGTVRNNAVVIYITQANAGNFANPWNTTAGATGLFLNGRTPNRHGTNANAVSLLNATPLVIRIIGSPDLRFATRNNNQLDIARTANVTIEGIGPNAVFNGFGLFIDRSSNVVVRNIHFRDWGTQDGILVQGAGGNPNTHGPFPDLNAVGNAASNSRVSTNTWITHNRFTHAAGNADGHVDVNNSSYFTQSYNVFTRNGRGGLAGNSTSSGFFRGTYHHNHYIDTNSRAPRLRASETHIFNNFWDYSSHSTNSYSIGAGHHANVIAEGNFFRNANAPFIISGQGQSRNGNNILSGDQMGFIVTTLTTAANHPTSTHNLHREQRIFNLAATLVPNQIVNARIFDVHADQGTPRTDNNRGPGRAFRWTQFPCPRTWPMPVNVTSAETARQRVIDFAGPMRPN